MSASTTPAAAPSVHRRALITWLAVYPTITLVLAALGPATAHLPLLLRTLILTGIAVPVVAYAVIPALLRANAALAGRSRSRSRSRGRSVGRSADAVARDAAGADVQSV